MTSDNIKTQQYDSTALNALKKALTDLGYNAQIVGVGPNYHNIAYKSGCKGPSNVLLCCFGGVDVGCIEEWAGELGSIFPKNYAGAHVLSVWYQNPYGSVRCLREYTPKAPNSTHGFDLADPGLYMQKHNISYITTGTSSSVASILKKIFG